MVGAFVASICVSQSDIAKKQWGATDRSSQDCDFVGILHLLSWFCVKAQLESTPRMVLPCVR